MLTKTLIMRKKTPEQKARDKTIADRLKAFRKDRGISQVEVGLILGVGGNTVVSYEQGKTTIDPKYLSMIVKHYNLSDNFFDINNNEPEKVEEPGSSYGEKRANDYIISELERWKKVAESMKAANMELIHQVTGLIDTTKQNATTILVHAEAAKLAASTNDNLSYTVRKNADYAVIKEENIKNREEAIAREMEAFKEKENFWRENLMTFASVMNKMDDIVPGKVSGQRG